MHRSKSTEHARALVYTLASACGCPRATTVTELAGAAGMDGPSVAHGLRATTGHVRAIERMAHRLAIAVEIRGIAGGNVDVLAVSAAVDEYCAPSVT